MKGQIENINNSAIVSTSGKLCAAWIKSSSSQLTVECITEAFEKLNFSVKLAYACPQKSSRLQDDESHLGWVNMELFVNFFFTIFFFF